MENTMRNIKWWHRIDLGDGRITPGRDATQEKLETLHLPNSLSGKTVLDIGAWDGFFSFEAERRGAVRVLATDGREVARGLPAYSADDARRIMRHKSGEIEAILGYRGRDEMIHRDDLALTRS